MQHSGCSEKSVPVKRDCGQTCIVDRKSQVKWPTVRHRLVLFPERGEVHLLPAFIQSVFVVDRSFRLQAAVPGRQPRGYFFINAACCMVAY